MNRPYIFCHMMTSLDGKITGTYMNTAEAESGSNMFYNISFGKDPYYKHQGWISGRITSDENFTFYRKPILDPNAPIVPEGDFIAKPNEKMYYISIDPSGKLGWEKNELTYIDTNAYIIEVLTEKASNSYKAFLRSLDISYIIVGESELDYSLTLEKLKNLFGVETLMLGGGGILNWSFLQAGMCDELSLVIAPTADGSTSTPTLFETTEGLLNDHPIGFTLINAQTNEDGSVWLRYKVKNN